MNAVKFAASTLYADNLL